MPDGVWDLLWRDDLGLPPNDPELSDEELQAVLELARSILTPLVADIVAAMEIEDLLPLIRDSVTGADEGAPLLQCSQVFRPSVRDEYSVLTVVHLDLSDPTDPRVVGELEIPGYSAYLHPMDEDHLLAIGMNGDEEGRLTGLSVKIFDVGDLEAPTLVDDYVIDNPEEGWSWSEALYDHHAFTFHRGVLAFPSVQGSWGEGWRAGLIVLSADVEEGLLKLGEVNHGDMPALNPGEQPWSALVRRSVFIEDALFSVSSRGVKVNSLYEPEIEFAEVPFAELEPTPAQHAAERPN